LDECMCRMHAGLAADELAAALSHARACVTRSGNLEAALALLGDIHLAFHQATPPDTTPDALREALSARGRLDAAIRGCVVCMQQTASTRACSVPKKSFCSLPPPLNCSMVRVCRVRLRCAHIGTCLPHGVRAGISIQCMPLQRNIPSYWRCTSAAACIAGSV